MWPFFILKMAISYGSIEYIFSVLQVTLLKKTQNSVILVNL